VARPTKKSLRLLRFARNDTRVMKSALFISITEYNLDNPDPHLEKKFTGIIRGFRVYTIARGRPFYKNIWNSDFYLAPRIIYLPFAFLMGIYLCAVKKIDTIVCQGPLTEGLIGVFLKFLFRKELIIEIHGDWSEGPFLNKKRVFTPLLKILVPKFGSMALRKADKIRTLTRIASNEMKARYPGKKYFVFPTFTDIDIFLDEKNTSFEKYILTVAVLSPIKDIETLIAAFEGVHEKFPEFKLMVVGDGPSLEDLRFKISSYARGSGRTQYDLRLENYIILKGKLSLDEVKEVMKNCYVFALPSLSEGFGRVFIEAMALGKPVIGTTVGGVPEIIHEGENGFLIEPKNSKVLSEKLEMLIRDEGLTKKMGEAGRKFVSENFSNQKYIKKYIDMINA